METKCDALAASSSGRPPSSQKNLQRTQSLSGCGGIVSAAKSGKVCSDDFPATRPRRYLNVSFGSNSEIPAAVFDFRFWRKRRHPSNVRLFPKMTQSGHSVRWSSACS